MQKPPFMNGCRNCWVDSLFNLSACAIEKGLYGTFKLDFGGVLKIFDVCAHDLPVDDEVTLPVDHVGDHEHLRPEQASAGTPTPHPPTNWFWVRSVQQHGREEGKK